MFGYGYLEAIKNVFKIISGEIDTMKRRNLLKYIAGISIGSLVPVDSMAAGYRRKSEKNIKKIECDVLIVGGGTAGVIAALQAARAGCSTVLVENSGQLGGTITTGGVAFPGLFHAWGRQIIGGIGWELVSETVKLGDGVFPDFTVPTGKKHPPIRFALIRIYIAYWQKKNASRQVYKFGIMKLLSKRNIPTTTGL